MTAVPARATAHREVAPELRAQLQSDPWTRSMGIEYLDVQRGYCRVGLTLQAHMLNHLGTPHGAVIFGLADAAFAAAANSHGQPAFALNMTISFLATAPPGARLIAEGRQRKQGRRVGFYDVTVTTEKGTPVAVVHCVAHRTE